VTADEERSSFLNLGQPNVEKIEGWLHTDKKFAVLQLSQRVDMHIHKVSDLRDLAKVATRLADELALARASQVSEVDQLRARVAELEAAAGGAA
jgi:hypothetical protein